MNPMSRRFDLFEDLTDFRQHFDEIFNRLTGFPRMMAGLPLNRHATFIPPMDAWVDRDTKKYNLRVALPGVDPKDVQLNVEGNRVSISGEHKTSEEKKEKDYQLREFSYGRFERSVTLPEGVDTGKLAAEYKDGMLEITAPVTEAALPRKIEIKSLPKAKAAGA
jgi:HSP20 family protein